METAYRMQRKSLGSPDETRTFEKGRIDFVKVGNTSFDIAHFEPGWNSEKCVKPIVNTASSKESKLTHI